MRPTKQQRNELLKTLVASGMSASELNLELINFAGPPPVHLRDHAWRLTVFHGTSESVFSVGLGNYSQPVSSPVTADYVVSYAVGNDSSKLLYMADWNIVVVSAIEWAATVKEYLETPDLWAELDSQREMLTETRLEALGNAPFTASEQTQIAAELRAIRGYLEENLELTSEQLEQIVSRLNGAEEASHRLGRKDWLLFFLGTTVTLVVTDTVPAQTVQHVTMMLLQGLAHIFGFGMIPPPLAS